MASFPAPSSSTAIFGTAIDSAGIFIPCISIAFTCHLPRSLAISSRSPAPASDATANPKDIAIAMRFMFTDPGLCSMKANSPDKHS